MNNEENVFLQNTSLAYFSHAPISLSIRELSRILALRMILSQTSFQAGDILDVGCGDGFWWSFFPKHLLKIYGIDISPKELEQAKKVLFDAELCDISEQQPFGGKKFKFIVGNCSLEHIPNLDAALRNIEKSLSEDGYFVLFVPTPYWAHAGNIQKLLTRISPRLSMTFSGAINGFFQHWHLYDQKIWKSLLIESGFSIEKIWGLGNERTEFLFRLFLIPAFFAFIFKMIFLKYPQRFFAALPCSVRRFVYQPFQNLVVEGLAHSIRSPESPSIYEYAILARKRTHR